MSVLKKSPDHRTRVAEERRARMRYKLLDAVMRVFSRKLEHGHPVIDDVISEACVSRGTFYQYFDSIEEAAAELGSRMVESMTKGIEPLLKSSDDPLVVLIRSISLRLFRGVIEPVWAGFVSKTDYLSNSGKSRMQLEKHLKSARLAKRIDCENLDSATDVIIGSCQHLLRRISKGEKIDRAYIETAIVMILKGVGAESTGLSQLVHAETSFVLEHAPSTMKWWKKPWDKKT